MDIRTGDIILTSKKSLIVKFMNIFQKDPCFWGHVLLVKDETTAWQAYWTIRESKLDKVFAKHKHYKIIRKRDLTEHQQEMMCTIAPELKGHFYGVSRIFLQALDQIFHTNWFTSQDDREYVQVCSSYVAWVFEKACNYRFNGIPWESCDPDDIEDDQLAHPELWEVLNEKGLRRKSYG